MSFLEVQESAGLPLDVAGQVSEIEVTIRLTYGPKSERPEVGEMVFRGTCDGIRITQDRKPDADGGSTLAVRLFGGVWEDRK